MAPINFLILLVAVAASVLPQVVQSQNCTSVGLQCSEDCETIVLCLEIGGPRHHPVACDRKNGNYCTKNQSSGDFDCSAVVCTNPISPHPFRCMAAGSFPSPYNCSVSYVCAEGELPTFVCTCDPGQYYDTATETCVDEPGCPLIPAECLTVGRIGDLGNGFCYTCSTNLYYFWAPTTLVFRCPSNTAEVTTTTLVQSGSNRGMTCTPFG